MRRIKFPTMLRKMWSGGEVQDWLDKNVEPQLNEQFAAAVEEVLSVERQVRINQAAEIEELKKMLELMQSRPAIEDHLTPSSSCDTDSVNS